MGGEVAFVRAVEAVQSFFWAQSSWAVVYCVCRDYMELSASVSEFERRVAELPLKRCVYECPPSTIRRALSNNDYMAYPITRWPDGRALKLARQLEEELRIGIDS
jgi:hypothetical protein